MRFLASPKGQAGLNAIGIALTAVMFVFVINQVLLDLSPFSISSIQQGSLTLAAVCAMVFGLRRFSRFSWAPLLLVPLFLLVTGNLLPLLAWVTFISASVLFGSWLTLRVSFLRPLRDGLTELGASLAIGLPANSALIWVAMHFPVNQPVAYWLVFLGQLIFFGLFVPAARPELSLSWSPGRLALLVYTLMILPHAVVPAHNFDDLVAHLFIPRQTWMFGEFEFSPHFIPGLSPCLIPIGSFTGLFILGGENAVRLLNISLFVFSFAAIEACARRHWGPMPALIATLFGILSPYTCWMISIVFTDSTFLLFSTFLFIFSLELLLRPSASWLPGVGLLAGLGYLAKQQIIFLLIPLTIPLTLMTIYLLFKAPRKTIGNALLATLLFAAVLAPALIHNYALSGNPVYPYYNAVFRSPYWPPENHKDLSWNQPFTLSTLWEITFKGKKFVENIDYAFGFLALVFAPLLLVNSISGLVRKQYAAFLMLLCALGYSFVTYTVTGLYMRYLVGLTAPLSFAFGISVTGVAVHSTHARRVIYGILGAVLSANFAVFLSIRNIAEPYPILPALTGSLDGTTMSYHSHFKRLFQSAGKRFGQDSRGLLVDSPASYLADTRIIRNDWHYPLIFTALRSKTDPPQLFDFIFKEQGISYIIMPLNLDPKSFGDPEFREKLRRIGKTADFGLYVPRAVRKGPPTTN